MKFKVDDTIKIVDASHLFLGCSGLITQCLETTGIHYRVDIVVRGCKYDTGNNVFEVDLIIPMMLREFEIERVE